MTKQRSPKQLANDKRLGELAKARRARKIEEDFEPTAVKEAKAAKAKPVELPKADPNEVIDVPEKVEVPKTEESKYQISPQQIAEITIAVQTALAQNPQLQYATPEQKLDDLGASINSAGQVQGIVQKHSVREEDYPNPTERLLNEPQIRRFAPHENFIFKWNVDGIQYEKNNVTFSEPKFTIELYRRLFDDNGELSGKAGLIAREILHDDEFTTRRMAEDLGLLQDYPDTAEGFKSLMNEIRYQRIRHWLISLFVVPKVEVHTGKRTTMVIDNKAVEVVDTEVLTSGEAGVSTANQVEQSVRTD